MIPHRRVDWRAWICSTGRARRARAARARPTTPRRRWKGPSSASSTRAATATFTVARLKLERGGDVVTVVGSLVGVPAGAVLRVSGRFETTARFGDQFRVDALHRGRAADDRGPAPLSRLGADQGHRARVRVAHRRALRHRDAGDPRPRSGPHQRGAGHRAVARARHPRGLERAARGAQGDGVPAGLRRVARVRGAHLQDATARRRSRACARTRTGSPSTCGASASCRPTSWRRRWASRATRPSRAEAGVRHVLDEEGGNGHVFVPRPRLAQKAAALLDLPEESADAAIDRLAQAGRRRAGRVGRRGRARARRLRGGPLPGRGGAGGRAAPAARRAGAARWRSTWTRALAWYEKRGGHRAGAPAGRGGDDRAHRQGRGHHRRPGRRQDHDRARHRVDPRQEGGARRARGADGARRQAAVGRDRRAGVDAAPPARMAPRRGELRAQRRAPAGGGRA